MARYGKADSTTTAPSGARRIDPIKPLKYVRQRLSWDTNTIISHLNFDLLCRLGAVYLDGGFQPCRELIVRLYEKQLSSPTDLQQLKDPKTRLQELLQSRRIPLPVYEVTDIRGQAHSQVFHVRCEIDKLSITVDGEGRSRRKAEQIAAEKAITEVENVFAAQGSNSLAS